MVHEPVDRPNKILFMYPRHVLTPIAIVRWLKLSRHFFDQLSVYLSYALIPKRLTAGSGL